MLVTVMDSETGKVINGDLTPVSLELLPEVQSEEHFIGVDLASGESFTAEIELNICPLGMLSLLTGRRITNNWLKYHGGVMQRKRHRRAE